MLEMVPNLKAGFPFVTKKMRVMNRTGATLAVGEVVKLDTIGAGDTASTAAGIGVEGVSGLSTVEAGYHNVVSPTNPAAGVVQLLGVVTNLLGNGGLDDTQMEITVEGRVLNVKTASATYSKGDPLVLDGTGANRQLVAATDVAGARPVAYVEVGGSSVTTCQVVFYGFAACVGDGLT